MNPPPVIVHAAADLRRGALLAETERDRQTAPRTTTRDRRRLAIVRGTAARVAALVSRIVDEFEPIPGPASLREGRTGSRPRP